MEEDKLTLNRLPASTVKLICSSQVITSVSSVVKELMENSLDAAASSIEIKLEGFGLDRIEIKDNGCGIKDEDVQYICQRSYTSKIADFSDLDKLSSYGFRGEALFALSAVSDVCVTTICKDSPFAKLYKINTIGEVVETKPAILERGTIIVATNLFRNLPVRKQFLTSGKRKNDELKKVEMVIKALSLVNCEVTIRFSHNKFTIWQKASTCSIKRAFIQVLPPTIVKQLEEIEYCNDDEKIKFTLLVPKKCCNMVTVCLGHTSEAVYLFVNLRPVRDRDIEKVIHDMIFEFFLSKIPAKKYPAMLASIILSPDMVDVNLEPNKTKVMIRDVEKIIQRLKDQLSIYYYGKDEDTIMREACQMESPKRKNCSQIKTSPSKKRPKIELIPDESKINAQLGDDVVFVDETTLPASDSIFESVPALESRKHENIISFLNGLDQKIATSPQMPDIVEEIGESVSSKPIITESPFELLAKNMSPKKSERFVSESQFFNCSDEEVFQEVLSCHTEVSSDDVETCGNVNQTSSIVITPTKTKSLKQFSLSSWSRGDVEVNGTMLEGNTSIGSGLHDIPSPISSLDRSVSSQMGQKDLSAFTKFSREMRKEIVKAQPCLSFPKIAQELSRRWRDLQDEQKLIYKERAILDKEEKKLRREDEASSNSPKKHVKTQNSESIRRLAKVYPQVERVDVKLKEIQDAIYGRGTADFDEETPEIVANFNNDLSIIKEKNEINVYSCSRLNEAIKLNNDLNNYILDLKPLTSAIEINSNSGVIILDSLKSTLDFDLRTSNLTSKFVVSDERITKNGFRIEKIECSSGRKYVITDIAKNIDNYGLLDLKEILECIKNNENCRLKNCRPSKAFSAIKEECIKSLNEQSFTRTNYTIDLYKFWRRKISPFEVLCPHDRPVTLRLFQSK